MLGLGGEAIMRDPDIVYLMESLESGMNSYEVAPKKAMLAILAVLLYSER